MFARNISFLTFLKKCSDDFSLGRGQYTEDVERSTAEPHESFIAPQLAAREVKPEPAEADLSLDHRIDPD
jgi:hypothetical protein